MPFAILPPLRRLVAAGLLATLLASPGSAPAAESDARPNVLLICVDDLRPELGCYGVSYIESPNIDGLAARGRLFRRHFVQAPTCGASRAALLTGRYSGTGNGALFERSARLRKNPGSVPPSLPAWLRERGYSTVSVGKVSHHPGGLGGSDWDDPSIREMPDSWDQSLLPAGPWRHPRGWMHGLANGQIRGSGKKSDPGMRGLQATPGPDSIYPDGPSVDEALRQIDRLAAEEAPFFLAVGLLRPHLPFGAPAKYLQRYEGAELPPTPHPDRPAGRTTWHGSGEFRRYDHGGRDPNTDADYATLVRKHYAACVSYADTQVGRLLAQLAGTGTAEETIVLLWGDHGWHLGEHAVWGKHTLFEESLHAPLIVCPPGVSQPGEATDAIVETIDLFPTLCDLTGVPKPDFLHGESLVPHLENPQAAGHPAISYNSRAATIRTNTHRLVLHHGDGHAELYDKTTAAGETQNVAEQNPELVEQLSDQLQARLGR